MTTENNTENLVLEHLRVKQRAKVARIGWKTAPALLTLGNTRIFKMNHIFQKYNDSYPAIWGVVKPDADIW